MPRQAPYLQRRGYGLSFRIAVPPDLRAIVGAREITKALSAENKSQATPMALEYAACIKRMYCKLRAGMSSGIDFEKLRELIKDAKHRIKVSDIKDLHEEELLGLHREHRRDLERVKLETENQALKHALAGFQGLPAPSVTSPSASATAAPTATPVPASTPSPEFKVVVENFLDKYREDKSPAMFKKHNLVLPMLLDVIGNKPITQLKQADINGFFELLSHLPRRWKDECRKRELNIHELAELDFPETLGPKTFKDTYIASVRPFLKAAKKDWQDQGFPLGLTTDGIEYLGDREEGESKQRAFNPLELKRLFEGPEMQAFAASTKQAHCFWLPHLGLFTGARVNEICQLNPQVDILQDSDSGVWYFGITKDTESDERIRKSVKTGDSRKVPIHKKLIELGFLDYVQRVKKTGAKLLFPEWHPINKRASGEAEKWFRKFLRNTKLRDETPFANILGMHAFRHTLLT